MSKIVEELETKINELESGMRQIENGYITESIPEGSKDSEFFEMFHDKQRLQNELHEIRLAELPECPDVDYSPYLL